jgi:hypothetical protein
MPSMICWPRLAVLTGLGLAACASGLRGQPDLLAEVRRYYDRYAMEEGGLCGSPRLGRVTASRLEEESAERLMLRVSYVYTDPGTSPAGYDEETLWTGQRANIAGGNQCRGFGNRSFTIARRADGYEVLEMTGPQRKGIKINRVDDSNVW